MKNLFFEGRSESGKTSLILKGLGEDIRRAGGFCTMRLRYPDGRIAGYRAIEAARMTGPDEEYKDNSDNVFIIFLPDRRILDESVFTRFASKVLEEADKKPFTVMDEFGGIEVADREFVRMVCRTVASGVPVIGVIKTRQSALHLFQSRGTAKNCIENYDALRSFIEGTDSVIVNIDEIGLEEASKLVKEWKKGIAGLE